MKKSIFNISISLCVLAAIGSLMVACSDDDDNSAATARVNIRLTDAPGDYDEVNVDIQEVQIHREGGDQPDGWMTLEVESGVYNLLDFTNGMDTLLATAEVPTGKISQIRLILGTENTLVAGEDVFDLTTPSAQQSGLKINVQEELKAGITYTFLLDFDAAKSIVHTGSDKYILKPVIRSIAEATSGAIDGIISDVNATPAVYAMMGTDTVATAFANASGAFLIRGVAPGTYDVKFAPAEGFIIADIPSVNVTVGEVTHLGTVQVTAVE